MLQSWVLVVLFSLHGDGTGECHCYITGDSSRIKRGEEINKPVNHCSQKDKTGVWKNVESKDLNALLSLLHHKRQFKVKRGEEINKRANHCSQKEKYVREKMFNPGRS